MLRPRNSKAKPARTRDPEKEAIFKDLTAELIQAGFQVRREKLKRGHGWKVVSGSCRMFDNKLIFVDQRMTQDDQIQFLRSKVGELLNAS